MNKWLSGWSGAVNKRSNKQTNKQEGNIQNKTTENSPLYIIFLSRQIIKRARQNYLIEQYIAEDLSLTQMAEDTRQALQVSSCPCRGVQIIVVIVIHL